MPKRSTGAIITGIGLARDGPIPLHRQLYEGLRQAILTRRLAPGMRLPWRAARSNPLGHAGDDWVFDYRWFDRGRNIFTAPAAPRWMYDKAQMGFSAIPEAELPKRLDQFPLLIGRNAVPFDPAAPVKAGDILPHPVLQEPTESVADVLARGVWEDGKWRVELRRKLETGHPDDKGLVPGRVYDIGFAVFEDRVSNRRHHVTLPPVSLGLGVEADIPAVKLE